MLNFVELTFSSLRYFWQTRPEEMSREKEIKSIQIKSIQMELSRSNSERYFRGYRSQHLRDLLLLIDKNAHLFESIAYIMKYLQSLFDEGGKPS